MDDSGNRRVVRDLTLDAETLRELEPTARELAEVQGGDGRSSVYTCETIVCVTGMDYSPTRTIMPGELQRAMRVRIEWEIPPISEIPEGLEPPEAGAPGG